MKAKIFLIAILASLGFSAGSFAQTAHNAATHPRRHEVNARLRNQNKRIHTDVKNGTMTKAEAGKLHKRDRMILKKERKDAARNGGHLTKKEERRLNHRENNVSKTIGK